MGGNNTQRLSSLAPYSAEPHNVHVNRVKHWWREVKTFFLPKFLCWYIRLLLSGTVGPQKGIADTVVVGLISALDSYFTPILFGIRTLLASNTCESKNVKHSRPWKMPIRVMRRGVLARKLAMRVLHGVN